MEQHHAIVDGSPSKVPDHDTRGRIVPGSGLSHDHAVVRAEVHDSTKASRHRLAGVRSNVSASGRHEVIQGKEMIYHDGASKDTSLSLLHPRMNVFPDWQRLFTDAASHLPLFSSASFSMHLMTSETCCGRKHARQRRPLNLKLHAGNHIPAICPLERCCIEQTYRRSPSPWTSLRGPSFPMPWAPHASSATLSRCRPWRGCSWHSGRCRPESSDSSPHHPQHTTAAYWAMKSWGVSTYGEG